MRNSIEVTKGFLFFMLLSLIIASSGCGGSGASSYNGATLENPTSSKDIAAKSAADLSIHEILKMSKPLRATNKASSVTAARKSANKEQAGDVCPPGIGNSGNGGIEHSDNGVRNRGDGNPDNNGLGNSGNIQDNNGNDGEHSDNGVRNQGDGNPDNNGIDCGDPEPQEPIKQLDINRLSPSAGIEWANGFLEGGQFPQLIIIGTTTENDDFGRLVPPNDYLFITEYIETEHTIIAIENQSRTNDLVIQPNSLTLNTFANGSERPVTLLHSKPIVVPIPAEKLNIDFYYISDDGHLYLFASIRDFVLVEYYPIFEDSVALGAL